jgi:acetolactate synthase-1/2/3 large subunit
MWAAQFLGFEAPNRWMTSGGLGTMGYGLPASIGVQVAHPEALVVNVAGEASWLMNMQEMGTAVQFRAPVKQFILNNERLGMVRQWQELLHGERYSHSWSESLPDFVKLAEAYGHRGFKIEDPALIESTLQEARRIVREEGKTVFLDFRTDPTENVFPMVQAGKGITEMLLGKDDL